AFFAATAFFAGAAFFAGVDFFAGAAFLAAGFFAVATMFSLGQSAMSTFCLQWIESDPWRWKRTPSPWTRERPHGGALRRCRWWSWCKNPWWCNACKKALVPGQRTTGLVFNNAGLEEVAFLLQIDHLAHPRERIFFIGE